MTVGQAIQVSDVVKTYPLGAGEFVAVDHLSLDIVDGEFVAVVGRSGSGKTACTRRSDHHQGRSSGP